MIEVKFDRPPVHVTRSGVSYVETADILSSRVGQEEIEKAARAMDAIQASRPITGATKRENR